MSKTTDKWKHATGLMSKEEVIDRWNEFQNLDLDDFYTDGKKDFEKAVSKGVTHLIKSATFDGSGKVIDFEIYHDYSGYIYLITSEVGLTKIGKTEDIRKRFSQIDGASPCKVELYFCQFIKNCNNLEKLLHERFAKKRVKGEWFNLTSEDLDAAKKIMNLYEWKKAKN